MGWKNIFCGDGAKQDENGYFWILGRVEIVSKWCTPNRYSEVERVLYHILLLRSAVVGKLDELKGKLFFVL
jgi:acetyl-CoA synthetase